jgi:hypothetical protein
MSCKCIFKVGDPVDWHRYNWRLSQSYKSQSAFWHGTILRDMGVQTMGGKSGHVLEVEWTKSNFCGKPFLREPEGTRCVANRPVHIQTEMCVELEPCQGSGTSLHPKRLS